jgi:2-polyprenyl-3-methyl-5-hydroxy-6-metoxy-1,4-benzoquinol methylase
MAIDGTRALPAHRTRAPRLRVPALTVTAWLRYDVIRRMLARVEGARTLLEIGTGGGSVGLMLARRFDYVGLELDPECYATAAARFERAGLRQVVNGDLSSLPAGARFDVVAAFEVLEHYENDAATLAAWRDYVADGGWIMLSVPACPNRFGPFDRKMGHYRRYDRAALAAVITAAGFETPRIVGYGFPLGYVLDSIRQELARREGDRFEGASPEERTAASGRWLQPGDGRAPVTMVAAAPFRLLQRPFASVWGNGYVALARAR